MVAITVSVILPARRGWAEVAVAVEALIEQVRDVGGELIVVTGAGDVHDLGEHGRWIVTRDQRMHGLRARGLVEASGDVIAVGEDHAIPRPGWAERMLAAHIEHADADAVVGCLVNATNQTLAGRANFLAFAAPWAPPMPFLRTSRPPPISALSIKRRVLTDYRGIVGEFESELLPRLFADARVVPDDRIQVDHYQDHGMRWSIANAFASARSSYGLLGRTMTTAARRRQAQWAITHVPRALADEAWSCPNGRYIDRLATLPILIAAGAGATIGTLAGPGRSSERVA